MVVLALNFCYYDTRVGDGVGAGQNTQRRRQGRMAADASPLRDFSRQDVPEDDSGLPMIASALNDHRLLKGNGCA